MKQFAWRWTKRAIKVFCAALLMGVCCGGVWWWTQPKLPDHELQCNEQFLLSENLRESADTALDRTRSVASELRLPSVSIAVSIHGKLAWAASLGKADLDEPRKAMLNTRYRTGSVAKSITGFAAAKLARQGKLELDASIYDYVPGFPMKRWDFTLRQLGSHTAGIRHYTGPGQPGFVEEQFSKHHYQTVGESLPIFCNEPLLFEPGTNFVYSTHGFTLLSAAMESAADQAFPDLIRTLVWEDLSMHDTCLDDLTQSIPHRATTYLAMGGRAIHVDGPDPSYKWAGGGMLSTPSDLVRLGDAMFAQGFVDIETREDTFTPRQLTDGSENPQRYTMGWRNDLESDLIGATSPTATLHHGGQCPGGSSFLLLIPDGKIAAAVMTNVSIRNPWPLREAVYKIAGDFRHSTLNQNQGQP